VAVDRVDEGDAACRPADAPADHPADVTGRSAGAASGAELERQAITRRLHRVLVDHAYGVARDAWTEAAPGLRAAWKNHQDRYPERMRPAPQTTPDGSWVAGQGRRLSPEQNAEAAKACTDLADEGRRDILPALKRVESADPGRRLVGLRHMLKGEDRLKEKIDVLSRARRLGKRIRPDQRGGGGADRRSRQRDGISGRVTSRCHRGRRPQRVARRRG
jgi:hypothetical protein